jgi:hypothetical protein
MMNAVDIPLGVGGGAATKDIFLSSNDAKIVNGRVDQEGNVHKFPGYELVADLGTGEPVNGFFSYRAERKYENIPGDPFHTQASDRFQHDVLMCCSGGIIYHVVSAYRNTITYQRLFTSDLDLNTSVPIKMCRFKGNMQKWPLGTWQNLYANADHVIAADSNGPPILIAPYYAILAQEEFLKNYGFNGRMVDQEAPDPCSHVVVMDTYCFGNNLGREEVDFSYPGSADTWDGDFITPQSKVDDVIALEQVRDRIALAGVESIELWYNDGSTPFSPDPYHINSGIGSQYSFLNCDNVLYWLDRNKELVACDIAQGVRPTVISDLLSKKLSKLAHYEDGVGSFLKVESDRFYIINFDTDDKTYSVNTKTGFWSDLGFWNSAKGKYDQFQLWQFTRDMSLGDLGASRIDGKYYRFNNNLGTFAGNEIRTLIRTPEIGMGAPSERKFVSKISLQINRVSDISTANVSIDPKVMVRWRDNGETQWINWRRADISPVGRTSHQIEFNRCGSYNTRQYEIVLLGDYPCCVGNFKEIQR